ncbi:hypothetical protein [Alteromonas sp. CYL-A6]|uniref:hypothetical protein n=1 Tax=Alteromonas nitratireducens TaxID=3390813 RepID=UPI0034B9C2AC
MTDRQTLRLMKAAMVIGIVLIIAGHYIVSYSSLPEVWGVKGFMLGACMMAVGLAMSLPTKMYLTFIFVKRENDKRQAQD